MEQKISKFRNVFILAFVLCTAFAMDNVLAKEAVSVYIYPASLEVSAGGEFTIEIKAEPKERGISGGEINLEFNPDIFEVINIETGNLFGPDPLIGIKEIDNETGLVKYALARKGKTEVPTSPGVFATINLKVLEEIKEGTSKLTLTKIGLADENFEDIKEIKIQGASIIVSEKPKIPIQYIIAGAIIGIGIVIFVLLKLKKKE